MVGQRRATAVGPRFSSGLPVWLLVLLVAAALGAAGWVAVQRAALERTNRSVELVLDYPEIFRLSQAVGKPVREVVADFKAAGITTLAVNEYNVADYLRGGNVVAVAGRDLVAGELLGRPLPPVFAELRRKGLLHARSVYFLARPAAEQQFAAALARGFAPGEVRRLTVGGRTVWEIPREAETVFGQNLGLAPDQLHLAARLGLWVAPRWSNSYPRLDRERLARLVGQLPAGLGSVAVFSGKEVLGYPALLSETSALLKEKGLRFGFVEFADQEGEESLAREADFRIIRVHSITEGEMRKIRPEVAAARDLRAVRERGIRAIYLRPFLTAEQVGREQAALTFNLDYVRDLRRGLEAEGFALGRAVPLAPLSAPGWAFALLCLGSLAAGLLLLRRYIRSGWGPEAAILGLGTLLALAARRAGMDLLVRQLFALGAGVVWATLGVLLGRSLLAPPGTGWRRLGRALAGFAAAAACSLAGAAMVVALLGENRFLVAVATFAGVKVLHALPLALVWFALVREGLRRKPAPGAGSVAGAAAEAAAAGPGTESGWRRLWQDLRRILARPVTWEQAFLVMLGLGVVAFYLLRTGTYTNVPAPTWERAAREALERLLVVRPRTKEFLVGHPAMLLAMLLEAGGAAGHRLWPLYVTGTIGQLSMVDTFSHLHTPLWVSAVRTGWGLLFGVLLGFAAYAVWRV
ncbi:MAG TPA: hypothetical protein GXX28_00380, partial [Firmicutes bacterium]|nr:hypothetical protein [Bacillota bacterium]